jgi:hypothetical protein
MEMRRGCIMLDVSRCDKNLITTRPFKTSPLFKLRKTKLRKEQGWKKTMFINFVYYPPFIEPNVRAFVCYKSCSSKLLHSISPPERP